jgi:nucleoid-associated protein YgaU
MPRQKKSVRQAQVTSRRVGRPKKSQKEDNALVSRNSSSSRWKWGESYTSLLLGVVVVIIAVLFGVSIFKQQHKNIQQTSSISTSPSATVTVTTIPTGGTTKTENGKTTYIVQAGDDLWGIAEKFYNDGYKWTQIAQANNLSDPSTIFSGNELIIPNAPSHLPSTQPTVTQSQSNTPNAITGSSYTVQAGDDLWSLAVRAYGDGYKWTQIAQANNLSDPNIIHSGNILKIPR